LGRRLLHNAPKLMFIQAISMFLDVRIQEKQILMRKCDIQNLCFKLDILYGMDIGVTVNILTIDVGGVTLKKKGP
jgi:hypothetical protein